MCFLWAEVCPTEATPICSSPCHRWHQQEPQLLALPVGDAPNPEGQQAPLGTARWVLGDLVSHTTWCDWPDPDHRPSVTLSGCCQLAGAGDGSCMQSGGKGCVRAMAGRPAGRPGVSQRGPAPETSHSLRPPLSSAGPHPEQARKGTHLTEPRRLPFSFSWLRLGRCTPVSHRGGQVRGHLSAPPEALAPSAPTARGCPEAQRHCFRL